MTQRRWLIALAVVIFGGVANQAFAQNWAEGRHYFSLRAPQRTSVAAGQVEVMEVFSYGCPACYQFNSVAKAIQNSLPANARFVYLPASWNEPEAWPMFQRAYLTAVALGIHVRTHDAMLDAVWKTGELGVVDQATGRLKARKPTIEDAAKFYARTAGIDAKKFLDFSKSFSVETKMRAADRQIIDMQVDSTPTIVVNGRYRMTARSAGGPQQLVELVKYLVARESARTK